MAKKDYKQTLSIQCPSTTNSWQRHRLTVNSVMAYLRTNPTLDESRPPMRWAQGVTSCNYRLSNAYYYGNDRAKQQKAKANAEKAHIIPWDTLRNFIDQHPQLSLVFRNKAPKVITKVETVYVNTALGMSPEEKAEMVLALQRQQHIRNEYVRRAYVARERAETTGNEAVYQAELDAQCAGMGTLKSLMERLEIPMADWTDKELALAQAAVIAEKEGTDALHVLVSGGDG